MMVTSDLAPHDGILSVSAVRHARSKTRASRTSRPGLVGGLRNQHVDPSVIENKRERRQRGEKACRMGANVPRGVGGV